MEHQFLWHTLETFGFPPEFIAMIKVLYCELESILKVNGGLCSHFKIKRGIRQGCALSGMLYSITLEPILNKIRVELDGFKCENFFPPIKLSAYADDIMVLINGQNDINKVVDIVNSYGKFSSTKVN